MLIICQPCPEDWFHVKIPETCTDSLEVDVIDHSAGISRESWKAHQHHKQTIYTWLKKKKKL